MKIDIVTIFPKMFEGPLGEGMVKRAVDKGVVEIKIHDLRNWAEDKHKSVDDRPYGGGAGMVMRVDVMDRAIDSIKFEVRSSKPETNSKSEQSKFKTVLLSAKGKPYTQAMAREYAELDRLILIAGRYEGVDERVAEHLVDEEIRIGDYVLTGGELPAMVVVDSVVRLLPGVLGNEQSSKDESHSKRGYLEYPHYTRPEAYKGWRVPEVLLSGNHAQIEKWRKKKSGSVHR